MICLSADDSNVGIRADNYKLYGLSQIGGAKDFVVSCHTKNMQKVNGLSIMYNHAATKQMNHIHKNIFGIFLKEPYLSTGQDLSSNLSSAR